MTPPTGPVAAGREPSRPLELVLSVEREAPGTLGAQIEGQLRRAIREGELRAGARVPSPRARARQLSVSRRVAVDAYAQLAAEGYLVLRQGAHPCVADGVGRPGPAHPNVPALEPATAARVDFRPSRPDVSAFPRAAW